MVLARENFAQTTLPVKDLNFSDKDRTYFPLDEMTSQILLYFEIEKSGKAAVLYEIDQKLHYVFLQKDDLVEFYFPQTQGSGTKGAEEEKIFNFSERDNKLTFKNGPAEYQIYETERTVGIKVKTGSKTYDFKGVKSTAIGSLKKVKAKLINVINEH